MTPAVTATALVTLARVETSMSEIMKYHLAASHSVTNFGLA
jgi:hypothetical protein